jgi:predicted anti-sigma-YlaC factor YlaD
MPRPPTELRRIEDEERRRACAHRRLKRERWLRVAIWLGAGVTLAAAVVFLVRLVGVSVG